MLHSRKQIPWPEIEAIKDEAARKFGGDLGRLLGEAFTTLYRDLVELQFCERVDALPTASVEYRGRLMTLKGGAGVADILKFCRKTAADAYEWATVTVP